MTDEQKEPVMVTLKVVAVADDADRGATIVPLLASPPAIEMPVVYTAAEKIKENGTAPQAGKHT